MIRPLWQVLVRAAQNDDESLSCDECFVLMDYLSDLLADDIDSEHVLTLADRYLSRCPNCQDEFLFDLNTITLAPGIETAQITRVGRTTDLTHT